MAMEIIYEDNHIIAVNKACGEIVMSDRTGDTPLTEPVKSYLREKYQKPGNIFLGLPHRIDRPTSGVVLLARTGKMLTRLNALFKEKEGMRKTYWAVVDQVPQPEKGTLIHYMSRNRERNKSTAHIKVVPDSKLASLSYSVLAQLDRYALLEVELHTGRHHQIRAQLAKIGVHIKGDLKYGFPRSNSDGGIHLHARRIEFIHPVKLEPVSITAPLPNEPVWNLFSSQLQLK